MTINPFEAEQRARKRELKRKRKSKEEKKKVEESKKTQPQPRPPKKNPRKPRKNFTVTREDYKVISGALDIRDKRVRDVMTRVDKVFMLDASTRLNFDEMLTIYKSGERRGDGRREKKKKKNSTRRKRKTPKKNSLSFISVLSLSPSQLKTKTQQATPASRSGRATGKTSSASSTRKI